ncbi:molybdopterin molybdotransferase MoeA [Marinilongibacter aquaticus]|uniref:molybdopterin molybdotransferase MoeA n=1 Tax=Marinilongibacter aquaticus TaxID=2975157 RepID=UPI0021BD2E79|nr:molybdopterin molybdotransferase MoeA [Marinilongibacter aquaticus]UBM57429.1 molybdopterin molybdotransferase MoeA [Marinilongibacter aquaticus]
MLSSQNASELILSQQIELKKSTVPFAQALGCVLGEDIRADRDFPPFDRVTMDGYALASKNYAKGQRAFKVESIQFAGEPLNTLLDKTACVEVMTGCMLPENADTVIRYEDSIRQANEVTFLDNLALQKNIHRRGSDRKKGDILLKAGQQLRAPDLAILATVGKTKVQVYTFPKVAFITSGDELVPVEQKPLAHQIRKSNVFAVSALLKPFIEEISHFHLPDDLPETIRQLTDILQQFDVLILSGGVSAGKKDYIPEALDRIGVDRLFHKIAQRPGKPMWFGKKENQLIFALPGNPVSAFMCAVRYVKPWFMQNAGLEIEKQEAILAENVEFKPDLSYFMQVTLKQENGQFWAYPCEGHGSGDLANLSRAQAFLELPQTTESLFEKGNVFPLWKW